MARQSADVPEAPPTGCFAVTPSDESSFAKTARAVYVGVSGDVNVVMEDGTTGVLVAFPQGTYIYGYITRINSTSTTATNMIAFY